MANNLDIYQIALSTRFETFGDFISKRCKLKRNSASRSRMFNSFYKTFLNMFGKEVFCIKDKKMGITILKEHKQHKNDIMTAHSDEYIIEGLISAGAYDTIRKLVKVSDNSKQKTINKNEIVSDKYYMYLYLPIDSRIGILMVQKRENSSIRRIVKPFFETLFSVDGKKSCRLNSFFPNWLKEDFLSGSDLYSISFEAENVSPVLIEENITANSELYDVKITLIPKGICTSIGNSTNLVEHIGNFAFKIGNFTKSLSSFTKKKGVMKNEEQKKSLPFVIDEEDRIHPVIKLDDHLTADENGEFKREDLKLFCDGLLARIKSELYATD